ncbi:MAG: hypothetical protein ACFE0I_01610 [Elainellaceae cyanobacterium]
MRLQLSKRSLAVTQNHYIISQSYPRDDEMFPSPLMMAWYRLRCEGG